MRPLLPVILVFLLVGPTSAEVVRLANGDELHGEIVEWAVDYVVIEHPQLGRVRLGLDQLDIDTGEPPNEGLFGTTFLRGWRRHFDLGLNGEEGNDRSMNIRAGMDFGYEDEFKRWSLTGRYFFNEQSDDDGDNNARVDLRRDWLFPGSRWFARAAFRYQFDEFESWEHRTVFTVGPGYHIVRRETFSLDGYVGPAFTREWGESESNQGEALLGLDLSWNVSERQTLTLSNQFFYLFSPEIGELRNLTIAEYRIAIAEDPALSLKLGFENEYETDVEPGDEANDLKYYLAVGIDF